MVRTSYKVKLLRNATSAGVLAALLLVAPAEAQEDTGGLGEIVVTARKRSEDLQKVPDSVSVFDAKAIARADIREIQSVTTRVPNISIEKAVSPTSTLISARGVISARNGEPAVAVVVDGVQIGSASEVSQAFNDVSSIQVLKGPQGALYGRNAIGGAIIVDSKLPTDSFEGRVMAGAGINRLYEFDGAVSGPITDKLKFRLAASFRDFDGTIYNEYLRQNLKAAGAQDGRNAKVDFETNKDIRARFIYEADDDTSFDLRLSNSDLKAGAFFYRPTFRLEDQTVRFPIISDVNSVAYRTLTTIALKADHNFDFATLTSVSSFTRTKERYGVAFEGRGSDLTGDVDYINQRTISETLPTLSARDAALLGSASTNVGGNNIYAVKNWSQELRLTSPDRGRLRWVLGGYFLATDRSDTVRADWFVPGSPPLSARLPNGGLGATDFVTTSGLLYNTVNDQKNTAWALFANADFDITSKLTLTLALRYDVDRRKITRIDGPTIDTDGQGVGNVGFDCTVGIDGCVARGSKQNRTFRAAQPKASLAYKLSPDVMLYTTYARGFRSGGFNTGGSTLSDNYKKELLDSFEAGLKTTLADGRLRLNAAGFYEKYKNVQEYEFDGRTFTQSLYNIPKSHIYGLEGNVDYVPVSGLTFSAGLGVMDSKIDRFDATIRDRLEAALKGLITNSSPLTPATQQAFNQNFQGRKLPKFSHLTTNASINYETDVSFIDDARMFARVEYQGYGKRYWWLDNQDKQRWVSLVDASLGVMLGSGWEAGLWCKNCANVRYDTAVEPAEMTLFSGPSKTIYYAGQRRTAGARVKYSF